MDSGISAAQRQGALTKIQQKSAGIVMRHDRSVYADNETPSVRAPMTSTAR